jgi:CBS domain-containing protein
MDDRADRPQAPGRIVALLETTAPFSRLDSRQRASLVSCLLVEYFEAEERILAQGAPATRHLYIVESGCVRMVDNTERRLVDLCGEGDTFGGAGLLEGEPLPFEATAAEPTVCALLPAARYRTLCEQSAPFAQFFAGRPGEAIRATDANIQDDGPWAHFGTQVSSLVRRSPLVCSPETTVRDAAQSMRDARVGSIVVARDKAAIGILTDTDLRNRVVAEGVSIDTPVEHLMSSPVSTLGPDTPVIDAVIRMSQQGIHHLVVTEEADPASPIKGVISNKDISQAGDLSPAVAVKRIAKAESITDLARIRYDRDRLALHLYGRGVHPGDLMVIMTEITDRLTARLIHLATESLREKHPQAVVDTPWAWLALGSKGRREMGLTGDQDNALLYTDPESPAANEQAQRWFRLVAKRVNLGLAECGFPFCNGGIMAANPKWCRPLEDWKEIFRAWILNPEPKALMHSSIFFDLRAVHGDAGLVDNLNEGLAEDLRHERGFLAFLAHNAVSTRPPLSFFQRFLVDHSGEYRHTFDIKLHGVRPIIDLARLLALEEQHLDSTNTFDRLEHAGARLSGVGALASSAADAYRYLLDLRLGHELGQVEKGLKPDNHINPDSLTKTQQRMLRAVFSTVRDLQENLARRYGAHMMRR